MACFNDYLSIWYAFRILKRGKIMIIKTIIIILILAIILYFVIKSVIKDFSEKDGCSSCSQAGHCRYREENKEEKK